MNAAFGAVISACASYYVAEKYFSREENTSGIQPYTLGGSYTQSTKKISQSGNFFKKDTVSSPLQRLSYPHFQIIYSNYHKSPLAVHETITKQITFGKVPRYDKFYPDNQIKNRAFLVNQSYYADTHAFEHFYIHRGHMAPAGNYSNDSKSNYYSFSFANILPQNGYNNTGIWNTFQRYSRDLLEKNKCEKVEIINGPIYPKNSPFSKHTEKQKSFTNKLPVLKENGIPIPAKLYKIIQCHTKEGKYFQAFQFLNQRTTDNEKKLDQFEVQIKILEQQTGLRFRMKGKPMKLLEDNGLRSKKREYDLPFYLTMIKKAETVDGMSGGLNRARQQGLDFDLRILKDNITQKAQRQLKLKGETPCKGLIKLLKLEKALTTFSKHKELKQVKETLKDSLYNTLQSQYLECKRSDSKDRQNLSKYNNSQMVEEYQRSIKETRLK